MGHFDSKKYPKSETPWGIEFRLTINALPTTGGMTTRAASKQFIERKRPASHPVPVMAATEMSE